MYGPLSQFPSTLLPVLPHALKRREERGDREDSSGLHSAEPRPPAESQTSPCLQDHCVRLEPGLCAVNTRPWDPAGRSAFARCTSRASRGCEAPDSAPLRGGDSDGRDPLQHLVAPPNAGWPKRLTLGRRCAALPFYPLTKPASSTAAPHCPCRPSAATAPTCGRDNSPERQFLSV